jgi:hypothetical protein
MKSESSGQSRPRTRVKSLTNGADKPWSGEPGAPLSGLEPESGQAQASQADAAPLPSREEKIAIIAYYKAERRGFTNSGELDDWLEAEREVDRLANGQDIEKP